MDNYNASILLLGLRDQNMPVFKEARVRRLASIGKMTKLINVAQRLTPKVPEEIFALNPNDPEWDDKMVYPTVNYAKLGYQSCYWGIFNFFCVYNWNIIHGNKRLRLLAYSYPIISACMLTSMYSTYSTAVEKITLFEDYCKVRALELAESNRYLLNHEHFKRWVYFNEDLRETLESVHRQANNHEASDFKDSELILQDFIRRHSDPANPDAAMFNENGSIKLLN